MSTSRPPKAVSGFLMPCKNYTAPVWDFAAKQAKGAKVLFSRQAD